MNEERLTELRRWGAITMGARKEGTREAGRMLVEAAKEIDQLRAESEWLITLLGRALVYVDAANMPASWELGDAIRLAISKEAAL